jgi:hypothetical protein
MVLNEERWVLAGELAELCHCGDALNLFEFSSILVAHFQYSWLDRATSDFYFGSYLCITCQTTEPI